VNDVRENSDGRPRRRSPTARPVKRSAKLIAPIVAVRSLIRVSVRRNSYPNLRECLPWCSEKVARGFQVRGV